MVRIWAISTNAVVLVLSETWLNKSISDKDVSVGGYNLFRIGRPKKGGGVAIYVKKSFLVNVIVSKSISRQFELLDLDLEVSKSLHIMVVGCYRPPSADSSTLSSLREFLTSLNYNEIVSISRS